MSEKWRGATTTEKTVQELAGELSNAFVRDKRNDGQEFTHLAKGSPKWMTEVIHAVHGDKMPDDTVYGFVERCADAIAGHDDPSDAVTEIEPDGYTSSLTSWLNARADHVHYLTEALEEGLDITDGFQLLAYAQQKQIQEVGFALISELEKISEA